MNQEGKKENNIYSRRVIGQIMFMNNMHKRILDRAVAKTGVFRSQHQFLMHIARFPDASQKDIASHYHISTATVAVGLKKLEKGGYIVRAAAETDNRFNQIAITEKGEEVVKQSIHIFQNLEEGMFLGFSNEEMIQLGNYMERINKNLKELFPKAERED